VGALASAAAGAACMRPAKQCNQSLTATLFANQLNFKALCKINYFKANIHTFKHPATLVLRLEKNTPREAGKPRAKCKNMITDTPYKLILLLHEANSATKQQFARALYLDLQL